MVQDASQGTFPHGHFKMFASTDNLLYRISKLQLPKLYPPTPDELTAVAKAQLGEFRAAVGTDTPADFGVEEKNFTVDQLACILRRWALEKHGLKVGLGVVYEEKLPIDSLYQPLHSSHHSHTCFYRSVIKCYLLSDDYAFLLRIPSSTPYFKSLKAGAFFINSSQVVNLSSTSLCVQSRLSPP